MIFDVTIVIVLGRHKLHPYEGIDLINVGCVLTAPTTSHCPISPLLLGPPCSLRHNTVEIRPVNNLSCPLECSNERKSCISLTLNKKLEMITLSKEAMLKLQMMVSIFFRYKVCIS